MQTNNQIWLDDDETDSSDIDRDLDTNVQFDAASDRILFQAAWATTGDAATGGPVRHSVVLALDTRTMERYACLDPAARTRVHTMLHDVVRRMVEHLPDPDCPSTLTIELTDDMLDAAGRIQ